MHYCGQKCREYKGYLAIEDQRIFNLDLICRHMGASNVGTTAA